MELIYVSAPGTGLSDETIPNAIAAAAASGILSMLKQEHMHQGRCEYKSNICTGLQVLVVLHLK
ncbi:MAG: hypothetical protein IPO78_16315 [Saprospiraceae bacterium]|nr:hypothetical protein [Saprospiraceae bacterium]